MGPVTNHEVSQVHLACSLDDAALTGDRNGSENVISSGHNGAYLALLQCFDHSLGGVFHLILHDKEAEEVQIGLNVVTRQCLHASISH